MPDELELLTINAALDSWVDLVPGAISTGYQAQNTNIEGRTNGLEALYIETLGTDAILNPSGVIDDNGAPMVVKTQVTLAVPSGQRFIRVIDGGSPTTRSLQLESAIGAYEESKNGYYTSGDRILNWSLNDISGSLKSYKILAPLHAHILGDALFDGNITQTSGVTSLKATTITDSGVNVLGVYRTLNTSGSGARLNFYGNNSVNTKTQYAFIRNEIVTNVAGSENGSLEFATLKNGVITPYMLLNNNGRLILDDSLVDNTIDLAQFGANLDKSFSFGRLKLGYNGTTDSAVLGHYDQFTGNDFGLKFSNIGTTILNSTLANLVFISNGNVPSATFGSTAIDLLKPVTITGDLSFSGVAVRTITGSQDKSLDINILADLASDGLYIKRNGSTVVSFTGTATAIEGELHPTASANLDTFSLTTTAQLIPRGIYSVEHTIGSTIYTTVQMQTSTGVWVIVSTGRSDIVGETQGDVIFSDGVNFRVLISTGTGSMNYRKF